MSDLKIFITLQSNDCRTQFHGTKCLIVSDRSSDSLLLIRRKKMKLTAAKFSAICHSRIKAVQRGGFSSDFQSHEAYHGYDIPLLVSGVTDLKM